MANNHEVSGSFGGRGAPIHVVAHPQGTMVEEFARYIILVPPDSRLPGR